MTDDPFKPLRTYEEATPGPWGVSPSTQVVVTSRGFGVAGLSLLTKTANARHIATWDPETCREVVGLLEEAAATYDDGRRFCDGLGALLERLRGQP